MTPAQRAFLKAKRAVERLRQEIDDTTAKFERLLALHAELIAPVLEILSARQKQLIEACAACMTEGRKPPKLSVRRKLADSILALFDDLSAQGASLDDRLLELREALIGTYCQDEKPRADEAAGLEDAEDDFIAMREAMEGLFFMESGQRIDLSGLRPDMCREEAEAHLEELLDQHPANPKNRKKSKREAEREARQKLAEEARAKNINTVYRQLARLFHPDLEQDPALKAKKEALMKELTAAYEKGDLHTILGLELRWLQNNDGDLSRLSDAKLDAYTAALREQSNDLRNELASVLYRPRFAPLQMIVRFRRRSSLAVLTRSLREEVRLISSEADDVSQTTAALERIRALPEGPDRERELRLFANRLARERVIPADPFGDDFLF